MIAESAEQASESPRKAMILVVEDEVLLRLMFAQELEAEGFHVIQAASADEAARVLQTSTPVDVLLTDIRMPGPMDRFGLAKWVRVHRPGLGIILAGTPSRAAEAAGDLCEDGPMLSKPYD